MSRARPQCGAVQEEPGRYTQQCVLAAGHKVPCRFSALVRDGELVRVPSDLEQRLEAAERGLEMAEHVVAAITAALGLPEDADPDDVIEAAAGSAGAWIVPIAKALGMPNAEAPPYRTVEQVALRAAVWRQAAEQFERDWVDAKSEFHETIVKKNRQLDVLEEWIKGAGLPLPQDPHRPPPPGDHWLRYIPEPSAELLQYAEGLEDVERQKTALEERLRVLHTRHLTLESKAHGKAREQWSAEEVHAAKVSSEVMTMPPDQVDAELRAVGADPDAVGARGAALVNSLRLRVNRRVQQQYEKCPRCGAGTAPDDTGVACACGYPRP